MSDSDHRPPVSGEPRITPERAYGNGYRDGLAAGFRNAEARATPPSLDVLGPYLKHHGTCRPDGISILHDGTIIPPCECGLDALLARLSVTSKEER